MALQVRHCALCPAHSTHDRMAPANVLQCGQLLHPLCNMAGKKVPLPRRWLSKCFLTGWSWRMAQKVRSQSTRKKYQENAPETRRTWPSSGLSSYKPQIPTGPLASISLHWATPALRRGSIVASVKKRRKNEKLRRHWKHSTSMSALAVFHHFTNTFRPTANILRAPNTRALPRLTACIVHPLLSWKLAFHVSFLSFLMSIHILDAKALTSYRHHMKMKKQTIAFNGFASLANCNNLC